jgi:hypothetical protein
MQILSRAHPISLLNLSKTNKTFRNLIMSDIYSKSIWKESWSRHSFGYLEELAPLLPECPDDMYLEDIMA